MTGRWYGRHIGRRDAIRQTAALGAPLVASLIAPRVPVAAAQQTRIAAAADLRMALTELAERFRAGGQGEVTLVFGSSGLLARQIVDGAPFEVFLSANEDYVDQVIAAGRAEDAGAPYAVGRLALFAPTGSPLRVDPHCRGLAALLQAGRPFRFALANPAHAPYGRAARAVLEHHDLWQRMQSMLVYGENVSQAAQFAASGSTVGGLVAHALVAVPPLSTQGHAAVIPEIHHPALRQRLVVLRGAGPVARRFRDLVLGDEGRALLGRHGFGLPPR